MNNGQSTLINTRQMTSTRQMRALHRERRKAQLEKLCKPALAKPRPDFVNTEMGLKGECRWFNFMRLSPCPDCGSSQQQMEVCYSKGGMNPEYRVTCNRWPTSCTQRTPWLPSSQLAVRHWKLTAALSK